MRYRKTERKDIENDFYANDSSNGNLDIKFRKAIGDALTLSISFATRLPCTHGHRS
jgi:hypothetical protein